MNSEIVFNPNQPLEGSSVGSRKSGARPVLPLCAACLLLLSSAAAWATGSLQGQNKGDTNNWVSVNLMGWEELDFIPCRFYFTSSPGIQGVTITFPHLAGTIPGFEDLTDFAPFSSNIVFISPPVLNAAASGTWSYSFTIDITDSNPADLRFFARLAAGAHLNGGSSLQMKSGLGNLQIHKPAPCPGTTELDLVKTGPATVLQGGIITYTLSYTNTSGTNTAVGTQVSDILPAGVTILTNSLSANAHAVGNTIFWDVLNFVPHASGIITFQVQVDLSVPGGTVLTNYAQILSCEDGMNMIDNVSTWLTTVTALCFPPSITNNPSSKTVCSGQSATFSVSASGSLPFAYQWQRNGTNIAGATTNTYTIASVSANDAGAYRAVLTNACGSSTSAVATLTVNLPVQVSSGPTSLTNCPATTASFSVTASGTSLAYQWFKGSSPLSGQTSNSLTLNSVTPPDAGIYSVVVSGICGNPVTNSASLTVIPPPTITCTANKTVNCGSIWSFDGPAFSSPYTSVSLSILSTITNGACPQVITRTWVATDACGSTNACSQTVTVADTNPPSLTVPTGSNLGCNPTNLPTDAAVASQVTASDTCSAVTTNITHLDTTDACIVTRRFTVRATDGCGNSASNTVVYTWTSDSTPPALNVPPGSDLGCNPTNLPTDASVAALVNATDTCSALTTNITHVDATNGCSISRTFTVIATDACGNTATATVLYNWTSDTTPPVLIVPSGANLGCNPTNVPTDVMVAALVNATDNCGVVTTNVTHVDDGTLCLSNRTFTIVVADGCGNRATNTVVYTWTSDVIPPVISAPSGTISLGCNPTLPTDASVAALVRTSDSCSVASTNITHVDDGTSCLSTRSFTIVVADACGNRATNTVVYTWTADTTPPTISAPSGTIALGCNPTLPIDSGVAALVVASDACSLASTNVTHVDDGSLCLSNRTFTIVVADGCGNRATNTVIYTWTRDITPPTVSAPSGTIALGCNPTLPSAATVAALVVASDACSLVATNITHVDDGTLCLSNRTFTIVVADGCGNRATNTVVYTWTADTAPPSISAPSGTVALGCNPILPTDASVAALVLASDACSLASTNITHIDAGTLCLSNRAFTIVVADGCGNRATNTVVYTWTSDTTPPAISAPSGTIALGCNPTLPTDASVAALVVASDACSLASTNVAHADAGTVCLSNRTFTVVVADNCGNRATNTVVYTWTSDITPPIITAPSGTIALGCNPTLPTDAGEAGLVVASDACSLASTNITHVDSGTLCLSNRTFTIVVADNCGNRATNTVVYTWTSDTTPPSVSAPSGTIPLGCNPTLPTEATVAALVRATDACSLASTNIFRINDGTLCLSNRTFIIVVADACGNRGTNRVTYNWTSDTTPPSISAPSGTVALGCNPTLPTDATVAALVVASDACSLASTNITHVDAGTLCLSNRTFTIVVADGCGNRATNTLVYAWTTDTMPPAISSPSGTIALGCNPTLPTDSSVAALVVASDTCSLASTNITHVDSGTLCLSTRTFTIVVADGCGNRATNTVVYTWTSDTMPPIISAPTGTVALGCNPALPTDADVAALVVASDACRLASTNIAHIDSGTLCLSNRTFTIMVADGCGNRETNTLVYTWTTDTTPPTISAPSGTVALGCNPTLPTDADVSTLVIASDACSLASTNVTHVDAGTLCLSNRTFTIIVADGCGNRTTNTVVYTWTSDTTPPSISAPSGTVTLGCNPTLPTDASVAALVVASDSCTLASTNITHVEGGTLCLSNRTFAIVVADGCGNRATNTVIYTWISDTTPPTISAPSGTTALGCSPSFLPTDAGVAALVAANDTCSLASTNITHVDGGTLCLSNRTFTIVVADGCGNRATNIVVYTWSSDTTPPTISAPSGTIALGSLPSLIPSDTNVAALVVASDNCSLKSTNITHVDGGDLCLSNRTFTIVVADNCDNRATNTVVYTWSAITTQINLSCTNSTQIVQFGSAWTFNAPTAANTNVSITQVTVTNYAGHCGSTYDVTRTWTATLCGNTSTCSQKVYVVATTPPTVTILSPTNGTIFFAPATFKVVADAQAFGSTIAQVQFLSNGTNLGVATVGTPYSVTASNLPPGTYTFVARATDTCANTADSASVTVTVLTYLPLSVNGPIHLDYNTGFWVQSVHVSNPSPLSLNAVGILVYNMPTGWQIANSSFTNNGAPGVLYNQPLAGGSSADVTINYYLYNTASTNASPTLMAISMDASGGASVAGTPVHINKELFLANGNFYLNFNTVSNATYFVQYSSDLITWKTSTQPLYGTGFSMQWIDYGPPVTDSPPNPRTPRFYRVVRVP